VEPPHFEDQMLYLLVRLTAGAAMVLGIVFSCLTAADAQSIMKIGGVISDETQHPQTKARGIALDYAHPFLGPLKAVAYPAPFNGADRYAGFPPPLLGEHSCDMLRELGCTEEEVATLVRLGTVLEGRA
jgi:hypothetical protein